MLGLNQSPEKCPSRTRLALDFNMAQLPKELKKTLILKTSFSHTRFSN